MALTALELHHRAVAATHAGRHAHARRLLVTAADRDPAPEVLARVWQSLAYLDAERGNVDDGMALCRAALGLSGVSEETYGLVWSQQGLLRMRAGDLDGAVSDFERALPLLPGRPDALARLHLNRGNVHLQRHEVDAAAGDFERCQAYAAPADAPVVAAMALHNLGYVQLLRGDLVAALRSMDDARPVLASLSAVSRAVCAQDQAEVLLAAGLTDEAATALQEAVSAFGTKGLRQQQGEAELVLARTLAWSREWTPARRVARRAARRFERRGSTTWALRAEIVSLGVDVAQQVAGVQTARRLEELAALLRGHGLTDDASAARLAAARAHLQRHDVDRGRARARQPVQAGAPLALRLEHRLVRAELARATGRRRAARDSLRAGLEELEAWQAGFGSLDMATSVAGHGRGLAMMGLSLAVEDGRPEVVLEWSERARALASRVPSLRPPADTVVARELGELRRARLARGEATGAHLTALERRVVELQQSIRARSWEGGAAATPTGPCSLPEVQAGLGPADGAMVAHLVVDGWVSALVVTGTDAYVRRLVAHRDVVPLLDGLQADLDVAAAHLPAQVRAVVLGSLTSRLDRLAAALWTPLAESLGDRPVALTPSGALAAVPWTMLPDLCDRPLTVARSATSWLLGRDAPRPRRAALVAGPRVARAPEEVARAARAWERAEVLVGDAAVADRVSAAAARADVLHVAAHGRHSADNPLFSGVELLDGPWFGYDIDRLAAVPSIVVLSACELGRSAVRWGAETLGMTVAWQHAGARCVIASPSQVDDDVACEVLGRAHEHLAAGRTPADALLAARRAADASGPSSSFTCYGAGW